MNLERSLALAFGALSLTVAGCTSTSIATSPDGATADAPMADTVVAEVSVDAADPRACQQTRDGLSVAVTVNGATIVCTPASLSDIVLVDGGIAGDAVAWPDGASQTLVGQVASVDDTTLTLDLCPPGKPCATPMSASLTVLAAGLSLAAAVPTSAFVQVDVAGGSNPYAGCTPNVLVRSLATWEGLPDPTGLGAHLIFAATDGYVVDGDGWTVTAAPLGCASMEGFTPGNGNLPSDDYALDLMATGATAVRVYMGDTTPWQLAGEPYRARNLRSYQERATDDSWNWAYWIVRAPGM